MDVQILEPENTTSVQRIYLQFHGYYRNLQLDGQVRLDFCVQLYAMNIMYGPSVYQSIFLYTDKRRYCPYLSFYLPCVYSVNCIDFRMAPIRATREVRRRGKSVIVLDIQDDTRNQGREGEIWMGSFSWTIPSLLSWPLPRSLSSATQPSFARPSPPPPPHSSARSSSFP